MAKRKYLFGLIGLTLGFIVAFIWTQSVNRREAGAATGAAASGLPGAPADQQATMAQVAQTIEKARNNPNDFGAQIDAAEVFYQIGRTGEAIEFLKKAHELNGENVRVTQAIGDLYFDGGKYVEAEAWYRKVLERNPREAELYVEVAATYIQREPPEPEKALRELEHALSLSPGNAHALGHLVEANLLRKDAAGAERALNRLKEAAPTNQRIAGLESLIADLKQGRPIVIPKE